MVDINEIKVQKQIGEDDCWATCMSMILIHRGYPFSIEDVKKKAAVLLRENGYELGGKATIREGCTVARRLSNKELSFTHFDNLQNLKLGDFIGYLNKSCPILVLRKNHVMLVVGYNSDNKLRVINPGGGNKGEVDFEVLIHSCEEVSAVNPKEVS